MRRDTWVMLAVWIVFAFHAENGQADDEFAILDQFANQNKTLANKLKQEAARLLASSSGHHQKDLELLRKFLGQLHEDRFLPREERAILIRKIEDRVRECVILTEKAEKAEKQRVPSSGPSFARDPKISVKQDGIVINHPAAIVAPDGGARVVGSYRLVAEERSEYGIPMMGGIPYLGRGFRNVGASRMVGGAQISATVRIISMEEEEARFMGKR